MQTRTLTGTRIRNHRASIGLKQMALAKAVGISAPYLNLIEHNRRKIAGKLLNDIARELSLDPQALSGGADAAVLAALIDASAGDGGQAVGADHDRAEEFAIGFPGWASLIAVQHRKIATLEHMVTTLGDRLTHDPQLAGSLHEVLSVATAIRSTSAILARDEDVDAKWQARFHRNLFEDAQRLAQSTQALVEYLNNGENDPAESGTVLPQEDLEIWLTARDYHIAELELPSPDAPSDVLKSEPALNASKAVAALALDYFARYRNDAGLVPYSRLIPMIQNSPADPLVWSREFDCDLACVLRRLASLPPTAGLGDFGLVTCDNSGTITFQKPIAGFSVPKFGAACPLLPLYQVLSRPMVPLRQVVEQSGHLPTRFLTFSVAHPKGTVEFDQPQLFEATMLILPEAARGSVAETAVIPVGPGCRICPREACGVRREPSILTSGF